MLNIRKKIESSIGRHGVAGTLKLSLYNLYYYGKKLSPFGLYASYKEREFDRKWGVDTSGRIDLSDLGDVTGETADHGTRYEAISPEAFHEVVEHFDRRVGLEGLTFIDYGSGKGRTLLLASDYPFEKIIGIEISETLNRVAEKNLQVYQKPDRRCLDCEALVSDALLYEPPNKPTVFYFYHPFEGPLLSKVLDQIESSLKKHPRKAWVLYVGPMYDDVMEAKTFLHRMTIESDPPHGIWECRV